MGGGGACGCDALGHVEAAAEAPEADDCLSPTFMTEIANRENSHSRSLPSVRRKSPRLLCEPSALFSFFLSLNGLYYLSNFPHFGRMSE